MSSHDLRISIERYPYDGGCGWGCPDLNLMGYSKLDELFEDIKKSLYLMMGEKNE